VRPSAGYLRSLTVLARAAAQGLTTKSGLMVGLGETADEVVATMADLKAVGVSIVTIGQYLSHVQSSPLTRSSYHAREALSDTTPVSLSRR